MIESNLETTLLAKVSINIHKISLILFSLILIYVVANSVFIVPVLLIICIANYCILKFMDQCITKDNIRRLSFHFLWIIITTMFFILQYTGIVGTLTGNSKSLISQLVITLGLPFYVLLLIGFYSDVLNRRYVMPNLLDFLLFFLYIPKFISGPIEKTNFIDEIKDYKFQYNIKNINNGLGWMVHGAFLKFILSDNLAQLININEINSPILIILNAAIFELRVYFDLSGYSFLAYGISLCLGIKLTQNFNHPFFANNIQEFWQRWHISLGRWFHYYIYTPIRTQCSDRPIVKSFIPLLIFVVSGMWHGATINFALWGLFHGLMYMIYTKVLRQYQWSRSSGVVAMVFVLVFGRLLFMESDTVHLMTKIVSLLSVRNWLNDFSSVTHFINLIYLNVVKNKMIGFMALLLSGGVIICEMISIKQYINQEQYYMFRQPWMFWLQIILILLLIHDTAGGFIYGRQ